MLEKARNKLTLLLTALFFAPIFITAGVNAASPPPPPGADINNSLCAGTKVQIVVNPSDKACKKVTDGADTNANGVIKTVINILTAVVGILAVIMIIVAGFRYVTSGGSDEAVKGAKNTILYAVIGLVVVALAQIIVHFVIHTAATNTADTCNSTTHKVESGPHQGAKC